MNNCLVEHSCIGSDSTYVIVELKKKITGNFSNTAGKISTKLSTQMADGLE